MPGKKGKKPQGGFYSLNVEPHPETHEVSPMQQSLRRISDAEPQEEVKKREQIWAPSRPHEIERTQSGRELSMDELLRRQREDLDEQLTSPRLSLSKRISCGDAPAPAPVGER